MWNRFKLLAASLKPHVASYQMVRYETIAKNPLTLTHDIQGRFGLDDFLSLLIGIPALGAAVPEDDGRCPSSKETVKKTAAQARVVYEDFRTQVEF